MMQLKLLEMLQNKPKSKAPTHEIKQETKRKEKIKTPPSFILDRNPDISRVPTQQPCMLYLLYTNNKQGLKLLLSQFKKKLSLLCLSLNQIS